VTVIAHHGGELPLLAAALGSGALSVMVLGLRVHIGALVRRRRRRP
jgi:hypothetical protein